MCVAHKPTHRGDTSRCQQESAVSDGCSPRPLGQGHTTTSASRLDQVTEAGWGMENREWELLQPSAPPGWLTNLHLEVVEGVLVDVLHLVHQLHGEVGQSLDVGLAHLVIGGIIEA